jgi:chaperonin GroES
MSARIPGSKPMDVGPLHDLIIVQRLEGAGPLAGTIIIPDSAKEKPQRGTVIAAGTGRLNDDGTRVPLEVKTGDTILFGKFAGQEIKVDGVEYVIMREDEVLAAIPGDTNGAVRPGKVYPALPSTTPT